MKNFYAFLTLVGALVPLSAFIPWLYWHGFNLFALYGQIVNDRLSLFAWLDVIVSAVVLVAFILYEGRRLGMSRLWLPVAGTLCIGVSFGLPLFLLLRELHKDREV